MPKTIKGESAEAAEKEGERGAVLRADAPTAAAVNSAEAEDAAVPPPWRGLKVAVVDDAMHPPRRDRLAEEFREAVDAVLQEDPETTAELLEWGVLAEATVDERLLAVSAHGMPSVAFAKLGAASADAQRMVEEHARFHRFLALLEDEVEEVTVCDPYQALPDLSGHNLILLDYYLDGSANGGERAIEVAKSIRAQSGRAPDQQIVLMSSLESVRQLRTQFREQTGIVGSAFAFIAKSDLDEAWKVKAHLAMLERARPYAPALTDYRAALDPALDEAKADLLAMVDDLDIGDYAFLQSQALMKDGHPLGDYVFWLLSSQLMAFAFEREEMRERQKELDRLEFVGEPFAATEPSIVVANLFHSALVSKNIGPLGPHPRARPGSDYVQFPLVQLGDVFLDAERTKAMVVLSADCDLAFSPTEDRSPVADTPVILVPGRPIRMQDEGQELSQATAGILVSNEVYQVQWNFAQYRSVPLAGLERWLKDRRFDTSNRDRLRPLFGLKLQQEFGAHLLRVGPPLLPPITNPAKGRIYVCTPAKVEFEKLANDEAMVTRYKGVALVRVTPMLAGKLKRACEDLALRLEAQLESKKGLDKTNLERKIEAIRAKLDEDDFWIGILNGLEMGASGGVKPRPPLAIARGSEWTIGKPCVVLEIVESGGGAASSTTATASNEQPSAGDSLPVDVTGA